MPALHFVWNALGQSPIEADTPSTFLERAIEGFEIARVPTHDIAIAASHNTAVTRGA
jgi:glutamyl-Q tRNA(Asp) synthetase